MRISDCSSDVCSSYLNPVGSNGVFVASAPLVAGQHVRKAEAPIIEALQASGALVHLATITHSYPHCWRHKTPLLFRATPQWFVAMDRPGLPAGALKANAPPDSIPACGAHQHRTRVLDQPHG